MNPQALNIEANSLYSNWIETLKLLNEQGLHPSARSLYEHDLEDLHQRAKELMQSQDKLYMHQLSKLQILLSRSVTETITLCSGHRKVVI
jgi:hypothetical protein